MSDLLVSPALGLFVVILTFLSLMAVLVTTELGTLGTRHQLQLRVTAGGLTLITIVVVLVRFLVLSA
jgi:hypothetical protein